MGGRVGSITTEIIADGLVFNMDAANRASYVPDATTSYNTTDLSISGSLQDTGMYSSINEGTWVFDGIDDCIHFPDNDIFSPYPLLMYAPESVKAKLPPQLCISALSAVANVILSSLLNSSKVLFNKWSRNCNESC